MSKQDQLWKAAIEEFFVEFLELFYPTLIPNIDASKDFEFLDKDLPKLFPESLEIDRKADRIVKIPLIDGSSPWLIVHIEVQGYKDDNFARRMFTYYYRLADRYDVPITTLVIYSDNNQENRVKKYEAKSFKTRLLYEFDTYVIADHTAEEYEVMNNPFAIIFQTVLLGINGKKEDEELLDLKMQLFRRLLEKGYQREQIQRLITFIREYTYFTKSEFSRKFDERSEAMLKNKKNMGIIETVIKYRSEEAREQGLEQGHALAAQKKEFFQNFDHKIQTINRGIKLKLTSKAIAAITLVDELFVNESVQLLASPSRKRRLNNGLKALDEKIAPKYTIKMLESDLIQLLLKLKFSEKAISKVLKCSLILVKKTKKANEK